MIRAQKISVLCKVAIFLFCHLTKTGNVPTPTQAWPQHNFKHISLSGLEILLDDPLFENFNEANHEGNESVDNQQGRTTMERTITITWTTTAERIPDDDNDMEKVGNGDESPPHFRENEDLVFPVFLPDHPQ